MTIKLIDIKEIYFKCIAVDIQLNDIRIFFRKKLQCQFKEADLRCFAYKKNYNSKTFYFLTMCYTTGTKPVFNINFNVHL